MRYYEAGLRLKPWALRQQLSFADLLERAGGHQLAREKYELLAEYAESDHLRAIGLRRLGRKAEGRVEPLRPLDREGPAVVLIPVGFVEPLLMEDIRGELEAALRIPVQLRSVLLKVPPPQRRMRLQWSAEDLHRVLDAAVTPYRRPRVVFIGVTGMDIFSRDYSFVFGWASRRIGVASYHRFRASFNGELPNRRRLIDRTLKQLLSSAGHVFGVARCTDPTCARAYPHSLAEHDAKGRALCRGCRAGFDRVFSREAGADSP